MAKDEAIRNQKVFIRMDRVLELQRHYTFVARNAKGCADRPNSDGVKLQAVARLQAVEKVIELLELPIT